MTPDEDWREFLADNPGADDIQTVLVEHAIEKELPLEYYTFTIRGYIMAVMILKTAFKNYRTGDCNPNSARVYGEIFYETLDPLRNLAKTLQLEDLPGVPDWMFHPEASKQFTEN